MNEIVYNILRKCVEYPEDVVYKITTGSPYKFHFIWDKDSNYSVIENVKNGEVISATLSLTDEECRYILRGVKRINTIKPVNL